MSLLTAVLNGTPPALQGKLTVFRVEEYRDKPKPMREKKVKVQTNQTHNMVVTEQLNRAKVLNAIRRKADSSSKLVKRTKLSRSSIYNLTNTLIAEGKVRINKDAYPWIYEISN